MKISILFALILGIAGGTFDRALAEGGKSQKVPRAADNSEINKRDVKAPSLLTPEDQALGLASDTEMTRRIRAQITSNKSLSTYAQNVKIITLNGNVTLRGPVKTESEKKFVVDVAQRFAGIDAVIDEVEVADIK